ncbi:Alpha-1,4-glucan:maltose-1-phosphate maltosyltransferase 1 [Legionella wadsworthii]|uniref:Alpha-1,4-glucan:maltose-1-phosphate maltosyltransferase n=1 Tax=Legionella wadsworthii TaxID=28088 RepID=A0A378LRR8_9GAMM|nr:alpha-1,4-glucan--maltose-1-phosphate maltosyltransferase [Legionella wadsworthii]STY29636.1 Alpha-1,4-glucan:maltose-1-phosphate maltosyltransferase 1 [Legionella wadsworthii]
MIKEQINGLKKVWINHIYPEIDEGAFPVKRIIGDEITVSADIFCDGIDEIVAVLHFKHQSEKNIKKIYFLPLGNDRWETQFQATKLGVYTYSLHAWTSDFLTWRNRFLKKLEFKEDIDIEKRIGENLLRKSCEKNPNPIVEEIIKKLYDLKSKAQLRKLLTNQKLELWMNENLQPDFVSDSKNLTLVIDPIKARFSTWYEAFPRSLSPDPMQHGTFQDVINYLPKLQKMGFDVLYLPPIHPIGISNRKGANNSPKAGVKDPGSPWAIGSKEGGHKSILPELGSIKDFRLLIKKAREHHIDIALDFAIQCSPDHPYLNEHPDWFKHRPDGTLQYAENPPKKYQDIYPLNFASKEWPLMWEELKSIVAFWVKEGVTLFRVDNPHTKPFIFWQWLINEIKSKNPEVLFLAEAFTRPKVMQHLAKCGFSQSYTYFTWRNTKEELTSYLTELISTPLIDYFRPNFWVNTPDILTEVLQKGGRPAFIIRLILAATLSANYGMFGPAYENCIREPLHEGSEEYMDSEKYRIAFWKDSKENISELISLVNAIRYLHPCLQNNSSLIFYPTDNPQIICYSKHDSSSKDTLLMVVNLDYQYKQSGFISIDLNLLGIKTNPFKVRDLFTNEIYTWQHGSCYVELDPQKERYAHILHVKDVL